jgi:hypothetical protein
LGSLVAQAVLGDYQPVDDYVNYLSRAKIAQPTSEQEQFINHLRELHKNHRYTYCIQNEYKNFFIFSGV